MIGQLPTSLDVNGTEYAVRTDFRDVLRIVCAHADPDLDDGEKAYVTLCILYEDFNDMPESDYEAAYAAAVIWPYGWRPSVAARYGLGTG